MYYCKKGIAVVAVVVAGWLAGSTLYAQKIDSIYFHLYTDSLKKGVYNYINVDARMQDGSWFPLSSKEIQFSSSHGRWDGNNLILDSAISDEYVTVTAVLKAQPALTRTRRIYIKKKPDNERLKTEQEVLDGLKGDNRRRRRN